MKQFSAARQDFCRAAENEAILCRAAGFLSEPYSTFWPFGHRFSIVSAVSHVSAVRPPFFPTFRPCDHRFSRFGPANAVFAASWPIFTVIYVIGVPGSRFGRFLTFRPCDHRFSRFGPANAVFASSWPICTVTYVIGVPGSCLPVFPILAVFPRFGRSATVFT